MSPIKFTASCRFTTMIRLCTLFALHLFIPMISAGELEALSVTEEDGVYRLSITTVFDAPEKYVYNIITDYMNAYRISPNITEIELLPAGHDDAIRVRNHSRHCFGSLCLKIDWAGDFVETSHGQIEVKTIPDLSSFESGSAKWEIIRVGKRTRVLHESNLKPDFFIPPVIGKTLLKNHIESSTLATFNRIECHAKIMHKIDIEKNPERLKTLFNEGWDCMKAQG